MAGKSLLEWFFRAVISVSPARLSLSITLFDVEGRECGWVGVCRVFPIAVSFQLQSREAAEDLSEAELLVICFPLPGLELSASLLSLRENVTEENRGGKCVEMGIFFFCLFVF